MEPELLEDLDLEIYNTYSFMMGELKHLEHSEAHELAISRIAEWVIHDEDKIETEIKWIQEYNSKQSMSAESKKKE